MSSKWDTNIYKPLYDRLEGVVDKSKLEEVFRKAEEELTPHEILALAHCFENEAHATLCEIMLRVRVEQRIKERGKNEYNKKG